MRHMVSVGVLAAFLVGASLFAQAIPLGQPKLVDKAKEAPKVPGPVDELKMLRDAGIKTDGPGLLEYLRKQTHPEADATRMETLIRELGDDEFLVREEAYSKLLGLGKGAIIGLKIAEKDNDHERRRRAVDLRQRLEARVEPALQVATTRAIVKLKPAGAAEVFIGFLPFAADAGVVDEVCKGLGAVAVIDGKVEPVVVQTLEDKHPLKRAAAAEAIARAKVSDQLPNIRKLLKDPAPLVRVRVGLALVQTRDRSALGEALPALIECLRDLPPENLWQVEDILIRLAGEGKNPAVSLGSTEPARLACSKAWGDWYEKNRSSISIENLDKSEPYLNRTLLVYLGNPNLALGGLGRRVGQAYELVEISRNKQVLWKLSLEDGGYPVDAQINPEKTNEVVIAEYQGGRVSIRDTGTKAVLWQRAVGGNPIGIQALPGGKVMVLMQNRIIEIDRVTNQERVLVTRNMHDIYRAKKTKNGELIYVTNAGLLVRQNEKGETVKQFNVATITVLFGGIDILANGNVLIPDYQNQRVVEYDMNGAIVHQFAAQWPVSAVRLPDGNTLVASQNTRKVVEFNRAGQIVWDYEIEGQVFNARRR